jgi:hypothetical protein
LSADHNYLFSILAVAVPAMPENTAGNNFLEALSVVITVGWMTRV